MTPPSSPFNGAGTNSVGDAQPERALMRKRLNLTTLELAAVLFVAVLAAAFWATQAVGCGSLTVKYDSTGKHPEKRTD